MKARHDPATKPYHKCLSCPDFRQTCAGLPTRDNTLEEWCELIRDVSDVFHLSSSYIAREADVSLRTVERIEAVNTEHDIMRSVERSIERVVLGPVGEFTCYRDHGRAAEQIAALQAEIATLREEVAFWRKENERKAKIIDKYLD